MQENVLERKIASFETELEPLVFTHLIQQTVDVNAFKENKWEDHLVL